MMTGEEIIKRCAQMENKRAQWESMWEQIRKIVNPMSAPISTRGREGQSDAADKYDIVRLLDETAMQSNQTLSNGQLSNVTPVGEKWFAYEAPMNLTEDQEAKDWFARCTEIAQKEIAFSNFYSAAHEDYLNRGAYGIGALFTEWSERQQRLIFREEPVGTYCVEEDSEQMVDTLFRRYRLTARQAVIAFREGLPEEITKDAEDPKKCDKEREFIHAVLPRTMPGEGSEDKRMPYASIYVDVKTKTIVKESGFDDFPYAVSRWIRWNDGPYGIGAGALALPTCRQSNFLEGLADYLTDKIASPPILVPSQFKNEVDSSAGGVTIYDGTEQGRPIEWQAGNPTGYQIAMNRLELKKQAIKEIFYVPLFSAVSEESKQMTAREVMERVSEKLSLFHPIFARMTSEMLNPLLQRVFFILFKKQKFPPAPESVLTEDGSGLAMADIQYSSRVALAIKAQQMSGFQSILDMTASVAKFDPKVLNIINFEQAIRDAAYILGMSTAWINKKEVIAEMNAKQEQAALEAQQTQETEQLAGAVNKAGGAQGIQELGKMLQ